MANPESKQCVTCGCELPVGYGGDDHSTYTACVRKLKEECARTQALLQRTLDIAGGYIGDDGDVHFTSCGYGAWATRRGRIEHERVLAENEKLRLALDVMLNAVAIWKQQHENKDDAAWETINEAYREAVAYPAGKPAMRHLLELLKVIFGEENYIGHHGLEPAIEEAKRRVSRTYQAYEEVSVEVARLRQPSPCGVLDHTWLDWKPKEGTIAAALAFNANPLDSTIAFCRVCHREAEMKAELDRLRRGDFTPEEFQRLCHNLPEGCTREAFEQGCKEYQEKLFGHAMQKDTEFANELAWGDDPESKA